MKESKLKQIKLTINDQQLKTIEEAFKLNDLNIKEIIKRPPSDNYFFVVIDEFAILFDSLIKVESHLKKNSDNMLFIKWISLQTNLSDPQTLLQICIQA